MKPFLALTLVLLFAVATVLLVRVNPAPDSDANRAADRLKVLQEQKADDAARLNTYAPSDMVKGGYQIPIERAMELTIPELNARSPVAIPSPSP